MTDIVITDEDLTRVAALLLEAHEDLRRAGRGASGQDMLLARKRMDSLEDGIGVLFGLDDIYWSAESEVQEALRGTSSSDSPIPRLVTNLRRVIEIVREDS